MRIEWNAERCDGCGVCASVCPQKILVSKKRTRQVKVLDEARCMGCFGCEDECHRHAIRVVRTLRAGEDPPVKAPPAVDPDGARSFDVVVVGAGPAGLGAAITCARAGLSVCVIERLPSRRLSHHPDGGVLVPTPGEAPVEWDDEEIRFPELDITIPAACALGPVERFGLMGPGGLGTGDTFPRAVRPPLQVSKEGLVRALADAAEGAGATLWYGVKAVDVVRRDKQVVGVQVDGVGEVGAKVVVAADGIQSRFSAKAGLPSRKRISLYLSLLSMEFPLPSGGGGGPLPRRLTYVEGDLELEEGMPAAIVGVTVADRVHVLLALIHRKRRYPGPKPMDHYLRLVLARDERVRRLLGGADLSGQAPERLNGCRVILHPTNRDVVRHGLVSVGDAFVAGGELGNVPALTHGVRAGRVVVEAVRQGELTREALAPAADFIAKPVVDVTEANAGFKAMPLYCTEAELRSLFRVMQHINYPTLVGGSPGRAGWMLTKVMARHAIDFLRQPKLLQLLRGRVEDPQAKG